MGIGVSICRSCKAPILWVKTAAGKAMPLDAEPALDGTWMPQDDGGVRQADGNAHKSHFATCPNAASHRKRAS